MNATDLVIDLVNKINSLKIDLDYAKYQNEKLANQIAFLEKENEELQKKIEDLEF